MVLPLKILLIGGGVVAAVGTGTIIFYSFFGMPEWRSLSRDSDYEQTNGPYSGKFGEDYARFMAGTGTPKSGEKPESNDEWWDWSFKNNYSANKKTSVKGFEDINRGAKRQGTDGKSLEEACQKAYKADKSKVKEGATGEGEFEEKYVWGLCSGLLSKPITIEKSDQDSQMASADDHWKGKLGEKHKADLLALATFSNWRVWVLLQSQFHKEKPTSGFFASNEKLWKICHKAYGTDETSDSDATKPTENDLYKWCTARGKKANIAKK